MQGGGERGGRVRDAALDTKSKPSHRTEQRISETSRLFWDRDSEPFPPAAGRGVTASKLRTSDPYCLTKHVVVPGGSMGSRGGEGAKGEGRCKNRLRMVRPQRADASFLIYEEKKKKQGRNAPGRCRRKSLPRVLRAEGKRDPRHHPLDA